MIYAYGITERGTYHVKKEIVCQDAHKIIKCRNNFVIAAVADGLGSEEHSDIASKIAVDISTKYCSSKIGLFTSKDNILKIIKDAFVLAQKNIEEAAKNNGHTMDQYDTTLSLAVFMKDTLFYGHSGDSGIVALTTSGLYEKVTEQQRDEEGRVFPLYLKEKWVFGLFAEKVCSVFLATDGMYETLFPKLIANENINIHIALAKYFMDNRNLQIDKLGENEITSRMAEFIHNIPDAQVNDDKTVVVLVNSSVKSALQPDEYYEEPDWDELKRKKDEEWKRLAYPHLFKDTPTKEPVEEESLENDSSDEDLNNKTPVISGNLLKYYINKYKTYLLIFFLVICLGSLFYMLYPRLFTTLVENNNGQEQITIDANVQDEISDDDKNTESQKDDLEE